MRQSSCEKREEAVRVAGANCWRVPGRVSNARHFHERGAMVSFKEAQTLANSSPLDTDEGYHAFIATERLWLVGAAEFAIEVLSTHESWKFISTCDRCEVTERCFRLLYVLVLPRKYVNERNDMIPAFEVALRETLSTDMSLLMKLLRSSCAVLSSMEGHMGNWNSIATADNEEDDDASTSKKSDSDGHFPLVYETDVDCTGVNLVRLESVVTTSLRFLALLVGNQIASVNAHVARKIMLTPIDDGGPKKRKSLTIVTLCGGYLGYSVEKAPGIAYWSLQILQQAAVVLDYRMERQSRDLSSMHSLVALFHGDQDLPLVRGMFSRLLRVSSPRNLALRKEVIEMLTLCLEHQPGFWLCFCSVMTARAMLRPARRIARMRRIPCHSWHCWNGFSERQNSFWNSLLISSVPY